LRGGGGIKLYPPSKIFAKIVIKNAIKHQKGVPSPKNFHNPYIPFLPKFGKNLMDPPSGFSNHVHLWYEYCRKLHLDKTPKAPQKYFKNGDLVQNVEFRF
jgi:hypothetical protein